MNFFRAPNRRAEEVFSAFPQPANRMFKTAARSLFSPPPRAKSRGAAGVFFDLPQIHFPEPKNGHPLSRVPIFIA